MDKATAISKHLLDLGSEERAVISRRFFKTGPGQYGDGDIFIGITVPQLRQLAARYRSLPFKETSELLRSPIHEIRFLALVIFMHAFKRGDEKLRARIYQLYLKSIKKYVNNWDLIDVSAPHIVGAHLEDKPKGKLYELARSKNLWERRVAMIATARSIRSGSADIALDIAEILVNDKHDLIQKAVGWMLREIGDHCALKLEEDFLKRYAATMPRTMLRYAIEKFSVTKRKYFPGKAKLH